MKRLMLSFRKPSKKLLVIAGAGLLLLAAGAGTGWYFLGRDTTEQTLYTAIRHDMDHMVGVYNLEDSVSTVGVVASSEAIATKDGKVRGSMKLECSARSSLGAIKLSISMLIIDGEMFLRHDSVNLSGGGDEALNAQINDFYKDNISGKWILTSAPYEPGLGFKEHGVLFGLGAVSKKLSGAEIVKILKEQGTVTVLDTREIKHEGKPALEYSLLLRRSTYETFMDTVEPRYRFKDKVLDYIFDDDTEEITLVVDKATKKVAHSVYGTENPCTSLIAALDPSAAEDLPSRMEIKSYTRPTGGAHKLERPAKHITEEDLAKLYAGE